MFGGGSTGGGFGSTNTTTTTGGFGSNTGSAFGGGSNPPANNGTANTPFQPFSEKDGTTGNAQYQTITFQQPYQNYSLEELRVADYNQGRRYGNGNGQAGAFGQSTGFGGFGSNTATTGSTGFGATNNTGGGLFGGGSNTTTTSAFGQNSGSAFGSTNNNTSGGLFGQSKPATGGLFGSTNNTSTGTTGGLFGGGSTTNTTGGFGSGGGGFGSSTTGGGGLFGQNKPATGGGLFGGGSTTNTTSTPFGGSTNTGGAFGQSNNTGGGLFGQSNQASSTPAFGATNTTTNTGGGLFGGGSTTGGAFGQNNQASTQNTTSGGLFGGGGFGQNNQQNQQKPGGLFGSASTGTTGGGLFGGQTNQTQPASGGLFGGSTANNNSTGGGLFGQKPATGGTSLFGGGNTSTTGTSGGGLFGNLGTQNNQQNNTGGGLFGGQNNNQQKPGGLFGGSTTNTNTGGGLFGGGLGQQNNNQQSTLGGSLFSSQNQQPQQQQQNGNSLFGASGSSLLNTSMNTNPYGNDALFAGLGTPTQSPGPLATPLSSSQKNKKNAILPQHKLNPAASTRLLTPQTKRGGYGFSYSTYGGSAASSQAGTPNLGGSLFANGGLSRSLGKSISSSNLRNNFAADTSILAPGAFSTTGRNFGNGSLKRLNINRNINAARTPLFDEPSQKRVSFAAGETVNGNTNGETALIVRQDDDEGSPKAGSHDGGSDNSPPEMQKVNGTELARVYEDNALAPKSMSSVNIQPGQDPKPGEYWSSPSMEKLRKMSKQELKSVPNFIVGRQHIGEIKFNHGKPVDLSEVNLDKLFGDIVQLNPRNATVYGETCTCLPKPPLGSALNQPSLIVLGNSWPRNRAGKKDVKHLERLKRVAGTTFVDYNQATGEWTFTVPHFSSYGLDYDDYSEDEDEDASSELSDVPDTPLDQQHRSSQMTSTPQDDSFASPTQSSPDDTFDFKKGMRGGRTNVPGGFGDDSLYDDEEEMQDTHGESFLGQRSVGSLDRQHDADYYEESESELARDQNMADSASSPFQTTEQFAAKDEISRGSLMPKSILKAGQFLKPATGTPSKAQPVFDDDWANQLQRTISPKKQDRQALRESQGHVLREQELQPTNFSQSFRGRPMTTAMDLMDSLFGETEKQHFPKRGGHGIEV